MFIATHNPHLDIFVVHIFNSYIESGYFPTQWKVSSVVPLPKTNNVKTMFDLRQIIILPVLSKAFEKILHKQFFNYVIFNNILPENSSGFRIEHKHRFSADQSNKQYYNEFWSQKSNYYSISLKLSTL